MTSDADSIIPDTYDRWPRDIQLRYLQELYALYFPERGRQSAAAITEQTGDRDRNRTDGDHSRTPPRLGRSR